MRFRKPLAAIATAGLLTLAACGGGSSSNDNGDVGGNVDNENLANSGDFQNPDAKGPVEIDGAQEGGTVTMLSYAGLNTMDPSEAYYQNTLSILGGLVTRSLTQYTYDPEQKQTVLVPDLATDLGTPNDDFTEWTFTIRDGAKFENGDPITADDIAYGIQRQMDTTQFPEGPGTAYASYFKGGSDYKGPYTDPKGKFDAVQVDGNKLTVSFDVPFPDFPYYGAFPAMGPIPKDGSDPSKYRNHPLASGPYKFENYVPEKSLTLVRNDQWDPATDPGRTAYPDKYEFDFQTDSAKIDAIMLSDKGATTMTYDNVLNEDYRDFRDNYPDRLVEGGQPLTLYWAPDYRKITDIKVRQALSWAYPYEDALLAGGYIKNVTRIFGTELLPPGLPGRTEFQAVPGQEAGVTDTAKAKALLEDADAVGYTIKWLFANDDPKSVAVKDAVVASLKEAGFNPKPVASTVADLSTVRADPDADINVRSAGWLSDWPAGSSWIPVLLKCPKDLSSGFGSNYSIFCEKSVDQEIDKVLQLPIDEQAAEWGKLDEEIMTKYLPLFVTGYGGVAMAHGDNIMGMADDPAAGMPTWKNMWVKQ